MTYISPRVAIWGAFCPPLYTVYNNSRSRKELRAARVCVYTAAVVDGAYTGRSLFPSRRFVFPSQPPRSLPPPPPPLSLLFGRLCLALSLAMSSARSSVALLLSSVSYSSSFSSRPDLSARAGLPPTFPASCAATVNHSAYDCVRLITVIRLFLVPVYRTLIIIIDFARTSLPCFHATTVCKRARARTLVRTFVRLYV